MRTVVMGSDTGVWDVFDLVIFVVLRAHVPVAGQLCHSTLLLPVLRSGIGTSSSHPAVLKYTCRVKMTLNYTRSAKMHVLK